MKKKIPLFLKILIWSIPVFGIGFVYQQSFYWHSRWDGKYVDLNEVINCFHFPFEYLIHEKNIPYFLLLMISLFSFAISAVLMDYLGKSGKKDTQV